MTRKCFCLLMILCLLAAQTLAPAETVNLDVLMAEIDKEAKALEVGPVFFAISPDRQSIYLNRPEVTGAAEYTIAYNIYDADSNPVNYFYSLEDRVAATPGYGGLFNVFVAVTDTATGEQNVQNIGWQELSWPIGEALIVGRAPYTLSSDRRSIFIDRPDIRCRSGKVTIAYNIYDAQGNPVNYFYSTEKHVAATPGYTGRFNVYVVVTDTVTGESHTQNIGWVDRIGDGVGPTAEPTATPEPIEWPVVVDNVVYRLADDYTAWEMGWPANTVYISGFNESNPQGELIIHESIHGFPVSLICTGAFYGYNGQTKTLDIPEGIRIEDNCFKHSDLIVTGKWNSGWYVTIDGVYYRYVNGEIFVDGVRESTVEAILLSTVDGIPVTQVESNSFTEYPNLKYVFIPDSVRSLGGETFSTNTGLTVELPARFLEDQPDYVFWGDVEYVFYGEPESWPVKFLNIKYDLTDNGEVDITGYTRSDWLSSIHLLDKIGEHKVTGIKDCVFADTDLSGELNLPKHLRRIGVNAFSCCIFLEGTLQLPEELEVIEPGAFWRCSGFTGNLIIPNNVTTIGSGAFYGCSGFDGILKLPAGIKEIEESTFSGCSGLNGTLTIPEGVTSVCAGAFQYCKRFSKLVLPDSLIELGLTKELESGAGGVFEYCQGFKGTLNLPTKIEKIGNRAFSGCTGFTGNLNLPAKLTFVGSRAFAYCTGFTGTVTIPPRCSVGDDAFLNTNLQVIRE